MKLFKQYIFESDQKKELFHSFFVSKAGKIIEPTSTPMNGSRSDIDHMYIPLNQPHDFDMTDRQMDDILELSDLEKLEIYKTGKGPLDASVDRRLSSRGFIRAINSGWGNSSTRRITLAATTTGTHDRHHLDDLTPAIKAVRERLPDHRDWQIKIYGLKFHEPHELETMRHRLSPVHIKQLTDGSELDLMNTDEIDRFIHGRGSLSRDPGSGVHGVPSPEEMRRKAGKTDEPESIQRGRFFQSDSFDYSHIKTFRQHLIQEDANIRAMSPAELRSYLKLAHSAAAGGLRGRTPEQMEAERTVYSGASRSNPAGWYGKIAKRPSQDIDTLGEFGSRESKREFQIIQAPDEIKIPDTLTPTQEVKKSIPEYGFQIQEPSTPKQDLKSILNLHKEIDPGALSAALNKAGISVERYQRHIENIKSALRVMK